MANNGNPERGDMVEAWLKNERDDWLKGGTPWNILDGVLDAYRLHADAGTPLDQDAYLDLDTEVYRGYHPGCCGGNC